MSKFIFDERLGRTLTEVKQALDGHRQSLFQSGHQCVCDNEGLCGHHAAVANALSDAIQALDLAVAVTEMSE